MSATFIQNGDAIDYRPTVDIAAGSVVAVGDLVGIARQDIKAGELGSLALTGVFAIPKWAGAVPAGTKIYWDSEAATTNATDDDSNPLPYVGKSISLAAAADTTIIVRLSQ